MHWWSHLIWFCCIGQIEILRWQKWWCRRLDQVFIVQRYDRILFWSIHHIIVSIYRILGRSFWIYIHNTGSIWSRKFARWTNLTFRLHNLWFSQSFSDSWRGWYIFRSIFLTHKLRVSWWSEHYWLLWIGIFSAVLISVLRIQRCNPYDAMLLQLWIFGVIEVYVIVSFTCNCSHCFCLVIHSFEMWCISISSNIVGSSWLCSSLCTPFNQYKLLSFLNESLRGLSLLWLYLLWSCNHSYFSVSSGCHVYVRQKTARICRVLLHYGVTSIGEPASNIPINLTWLCGRCCGSSISARVSDSRAILWLMKNC